MDDSGDDQYFLLPVKDYGDNRSYSLPEDDYGSDRSLYFRSTTPNYDFFLVAFWLGAASLSSVCVGSK